MILDSNAISDWWQGHPALLAVLEKAAPFICPCLCSPNSVSASSVQPPGTDGGVVRGGQAATSILNADAHCRCYASWAHPETQGGRIPMNDLWIAAIAQQHQLPILSRDTHFDAVENLERVSW